MADKRKSPDIIIDKVCEILKRFPDGLDYGTLTEKVLDELPDMQKNKVHDTFATYIKFFPKNVVKPRRGFYRWIEESQVEEFKSQSSKTPTELSVINGKLLKLRLMNFQQFANVTFDFTYPQGHEKTGEPLEKICFLGQSGSGKSTLLNIIRHFSLAETSKQSYNILDISPDSEIEIEYLIPEFVEVSIKYKDHVLTYNIIKKLNKLTDDDFNLKLYEYFQKIDYRLIYFPSDVIKKLDIEYPKKDTYKFESSLEDKALDFSILHPTDIWDLILSEIMEYNQKYADKSLELTNSFVQNSNNQEKKLIEFQKWLKENPNPIELLAKECLDAIICKFGVRVKTQLDKTDNIPFITLETNDGKELKINQWSTGTKHIITCGMPLYQLKPKNSIILIDEPESSLYPDVQNQLVEFYTNLAKNCQFFFSTHSPIVASSFEPYEIIELKFNESNTYVEQEKFYKGDRHINNYFIFPQYLTWSRILKDVFHFEENNNPKRSEMLMELAIMNEEIERLVSQGNKQKAWEIQEKYEKIADLLKWDLK